MGCLSFLKAWTKDDTPHGLMDDSIWVYLFSNNPIAFFLAAATLTMQGLVLRAFSVHSEVVLYTVECDEDIVEPYCKLFELNVWTSVVCFFILLSWTVGDIMIGIRLVFGSCLFPNRCHRRFWLLVIGFCIAGVGVSTLVVAFRVILEQVTSDLEAFYNVVGILYVMDIDEAVFRSLVKLSPHWHERILSDVESEFGRASNSDAKQDELSNEGANPPLSQRRPPKSELQADTFETEGDEEMEGRSMTKVRSKPKKPKKKGREPNALSSI